MTMSDHTQTAVRNNLIALYASGPKALDKALNGLAPADLDLARAEGKWTIRQIVHHIVDAEDLLELCIKTALGNPGCTIDISWYIPDNKWAEPLDYATRPTGEAVQFFGAVRRHVVELIGSLPGAWERHVVLTRDGGTNGRQITVQEIVGWQVRHLRQHIEQIQETREVHEV
jgi:hypothetical protein